MFKEDFDDFAKLVDETYALISSGKTVLTAGAKVLFFRSLQEYPFQTVANAMAAHIKDPARGQFVPKPADLIFQIEGASTNDSRPGVEEAWATSLNALDETETVAWTDEMCAAFWTCKPILDQGDEVGARMAFKESYNRQVSAARKAGTPAKWQITPGKNQERYRIVYQTAIQLGRLPMPEKGTNAHMLLESPKKDPTLLLDGPAKEKSEEGRARLFEELAKLRPASEKLAEIRSAQLLAERLESERKKSEIEKSAKHYAAENNIELKKPTKTKKAKS